MAYGQKSIFSFILISLKYFLRSRNIFIKISSKDLPMVCFVVTQHSESELSLCLRYSKTSSLQATKKIRVLPCVPWIIKISVISVISV